MFNLNNLKSCNSGGLAGYWDINSQNRINFLKSLRNTETSFDEVERSTFYNPKIAKLQRTFTAKMSKPKFINTPFY